MKEKVSNEKKIKTQIKMTHQEYDDLINSILEIGYVRRKWYPTEENVEELSQDPVEQLEFMLWILKSNPYQRLTEEQKKVEESLKNVVEHTIIFV